jgi:hypothetical protein
MSPMALRNTILVLIMATASLLAREARAQPLDVLAWFDRVQAERGAGVARKSKPVDVRPAKAGEIVVTQILGEDKPETRSKPAAEGDKVVRNRCEETGNEEFLVSGEVFAKRYEGPTGPAADGWASYRPRGVDVRYVVVAGKDGAFSFTAPWGEEMIAKPGDAIVQDPDNPKDTYRVAKAAFACTYEVVREAGR